MKNFFKSSACILATIAIVSVLYTLQAEANTGNAVPWPGTTVPYQPATPDIKAPVLPPVSSVDYHGWRFSLEMNPLKNSYYGGEKFTITMHVKQVDSSDALAAGDINYQQVQLGAIGSPPGVSGVLGKLDGDACSPTDSLARAAPSCGGLTPDKVFEAYCASPPPGFDPNVPQPGQLQVTILSPQGPGTSHPGPGVYLRTPSFWCLYALPAPTPTATLVPGKGIDITWPALKNVMMGTSTAKVESYSIYESLDKNFHPINTPYVAPDGNMNVDYKPEPNFTVKASAPPVFHSTTLADGTTEIPKNTTVYYQMFATYDQPSFEKATWDSTLSSEVEATYGSSSGTAPEPAQDQGMTGAGTIFTDVDANTLHSDSIGYLKVKGIAKGNPDGSYKPNDYIDRASFTALAMRIKYASEAKGSKCFPDVNDEWYANYVCFAKSKGFIGGYPNGHFIGWNNVTLAEAAKIILNVFGITVQASDPWYKAYLQELANRGAIPKDITMLNQKITRGQMAEIIHRLLENITDQPSQKYSDLR